MNIVEFILGLVALLLVLLISIGLHELGHLVTARRFGVPVSQYMIGFGPTLWSRTYGDTEYGAKLLPLGGYVRMKGMYPDADLDDASSLPGTSFFRLRTYRRVLVMFAGPAVNLVIALVLLFATFWGMGALAVDVSAVSSCTPTALSTPCAAADPAAPASTVLQKRDVIVSIDGEDVANWNDVVRVVQSSPEQTIEMTILRDGALQVATVQLGSVANSDGAEIGYLGVTPGTALRSQSLPDAIEAVGSTIGASFAGIVQLPATAIRTVTELVSGGETSTDRPVSLVGAGHYAGAITSASALGGSVKVYLFLLLAAQLNLALFLINMLPFPPFDGGHIATSIYQGLRDRIALWRGKPRPAPVNAARLIPLTVTVFACFAAVGLVFIIADIVAPIL